MECKKVRDIIMTDYIDGELDGKERALIDAHLSGCTACSGILSSLTAALKPLKESKHAVPPAESWENIKGSLEKGVQREYVGFRDVLSIFHARWVSATAMASVIALTLLTGIYFTSQALTVQPATTEITEALGFGAFNDMPNEESKTVYNNFIGG
jgi:predicted anti-sigma-YlaC factor YlaD